MSEDHRCGAETESGDPCRTGFALCSYCRKCRSHCAYEDRCDYDAEDVRASRSRGAKAAQQAQVTGEDDRAVHPDDAPDPPETLEDAVEWAAWASVQVATGRLDTSRANAVARLLKEFRQALERSEAREALEKIDELRERIEGGDADLEVVE